MIRKIRIYSCFLELHLAALGLLAKHIVLIDIDQKERQPSRLKMRLAIVQFATKTDSSISGHLVTVGVHDNGQQSETMHVTTVFANPAFVAVAISTKPRKAPALQFVEDSRLEQLERPRPAKNCSDSCQDMLHLEV